MAESKQRQTGYYSPVRKAQRKFIGALDWDKEKSGDLGQKLLDANQKFSDTMVPIVKKAGSWGWKAIKKIGKFIWDEAVAAKPMASGELSPKQKAYHKKLEELAEKKKKKSSTKND